MRRTRGREVENVKAGEEEGRRGGEVKRRGIEE